MNHRDSQIIKKIISEINMANTLLAGASLIDFQECEMQKRAVCMTIINIGELIKTVTSETRLANKQIPWKEAAGFRDIATHKYQTLKMEDVYTTLKQDFPYLKNELQKILQANKLND